MKKQNIVLAGFAIIFMLFFQNCAKMSFSSDSSESTGISNAAPSDQEEVPAGTNPSVNPPPAVDLTNAKAFSCKIFTEISYNPAQALVIPKRDADSGECFVLKIASQAAFPRSMDNPNIDNEVISLDHDDVSKNHHPYIMSSSKIQLRISGERSIKLSGGKDDTSSILVDNFLLVGIAPLAQAGNANYYKAYGSPNCEAIGYQGIVYKNAVIPVKVFSSNTTSSIKPLSLEGQMEIDKDYILDLRALDAGYYGEMSDIYLLFQ